MSVTFVLYPESMKHINENLGENMADQKLEILGTKIDVTEIVRNEVREAIKNLLASSFSQNIIQTGEPTTIPTVSNQVKLPKPVKVIKPTGEVEFRRRKRTQAEMRMAITKAMPIVQAKHPGWPERRQRRLAVNLVRRYKINV